MTIESLKEQLKDHQDKLTVLTGFILIASLSFALGTMAPKKKHAPGITIEEAFMPINNSAKIPEAQCASVEQTNVQTPAITAEFCHGKIKGNISSKGEKTYHLPQGSYYARTKAEVCFDTEDQATSQGFRKVGK
jgi:hypothetical protein